MKREIKFRAWTGTEMCYDVIVGKFGAFYVNPSNGGMDEKDSASLTRFNTKYPDTVPVMQFTGLTDKNGKEIYEGDILDGQMVVTWRNDLASFALTKQGWAYDHYFGEAVDPGHTEVIGNIYENKNLIDEK